MAIRNIPSINAPSFGGLVFSLDFSMGFSSEPSKLTYKVVNKSGSYSTPNLGADASLSFGSFKFNGIIYSYEIDESMSGKVLSVTLVDKSTILDRKSVVVFRPGLFGKMGSVENVDLQVNFSEDEAFYYKLQKTNQGFKIVKNRFSNSSVKRRVRSFNGNIEDIIMVGSEEPPDTKCEVASSSYTFNDLKSTAGVNGISSCPINDSKIRKTYEGTLRSVLNSWCQDFGISYYWDYSKNSLVFFDLKTSVFSLPSSNDEAITAKKTYSSLEGTYNQVAGNYFIKPFNPKSVTLSRGETYYSTFSMSPYSHTYFIKRSNESSSGDVPESEDSSTYGGTRKFSQFMESAVLGYISPALRKIYNFSVLQLYGANSGFLTQGEYTDGLIVTNTMSRTGLIDTVNDMMDFAESSQSGLTNFYDFILGKYDEGLEARWHDLEQDIFTNKIGRFYRGPGSSSGSFKFCSKSVIFDTSITYEPESEIFEDNDFKEFNFNGRRIFDRSGTGPSLNAAEAQETLGITGEEASLTVEKLKPIQIEILKGSPFYNNLISDGISSATLDKYDNLIIVPKKKIVEEKLKLKANFITGQNLKETSYQDIENNQSENPPECSLQDINENACVSAKDEVIKKQQDSSESDQDKFEKKKPASGLANKTSRGASVSIDGKTVRILSSSDSSYRGVVTYSYSIEVLLNESQRESVIWQLSGSTSTPQNVLEKRFILENRSTSENLNKDKPTLQDLSSRSGYLQSSPVTKVTYTCSDFVKDLPGSPSSGLENLDVSISDAGFTASYTYSTRPSIFPKQDTSVIVSDSNPSKPAFQLK
jgi:hypothetical protein